MIARHFYDFCFLNLICKLRCRLGNTSNDSMFNANNIDADLCISIDYLFVSYCFVIGIYVTTKDKTSSFLLFTKCFFLDGQQNTMGSVTQLHNEI